MFHVGQLVVCVNDAPLGFTHLRRGTIYTVAAIFPGGERFVYGYSEFGVELEEISASPFRDFGGERFRPLTESRLAVFRKLLTPLPEEELEFYFFLDAPAGRC